MTAMDQIAHRLLDLAARRWPADIRDEMAREWHAELAAIVAEPGGSRQGLGYAFSLFASPPFRDATGAPRGWGETTAPMTPAFALVLAGLLTLGMNQLITIVVGMLLPGLGFESFGVSWSRAVVEGVLLGVWCLLAGRWLGRRLPLDQTARLGSATSAGFASLLLAPALLAPALRGFETLYLVGILAGLAIWVPGIAALGVAVVRGRSRWLLLIGTPLISAIAAAAATLPLVLASRDRGGVFLASMLGGDPPVEFSVIKEGALSGRAFYWLGPWAVTLIAFGTLSLGYALSALRADEERTAVTGEATAAASARRSVPVTVLSTVGAVCVALAVIGWAYTTAVLSPAMPEVSAVAPMPGGDGEIYLWVAELRWVAILFAALGMLVAVSDRRRAGAAALITTALLLVADGALVRANVSGGGGLRLALLIGGVAVVLAWFVAGGPSAPAWRDATVRRRVAAAAVVAGACGPLALFQSTPGVNHPFLPAGLTLTTTGLAILGVLLASIAAVTLSRRRLPVWAAVLLILLPAAVVAVAGLTPVPATSEDTGNALWGGLVGVPLAVLTIGLLRRHRPRPRGRTTAVWTLLVLAGIPASMVLWIAGIYFMVAPEILFAIEGLGYPADGLSVVPGAALLVMPLAGLAAARLDAPGLSLKSVDASTVDSGPVATV
jgi:hypothetical protein